MVFNVSSDNLAGGPSNTIRPPAMPTMRSAKRRASSTSCMLTITGMARARAMSVSSCMISTDVLGSREDVGWSASRTDGSCITARDTDALPLTAGKRIGALVGEARQTHDVEQLERSRNVARRNLRRHAFQAET